MRRVALISILTVVAGGCAVPADEPAPGGAAWGGTITTEGDVTTVINESGSVWGGTATLVEEASIGVDIGDDAYMLASVTAITATEDRIFVLDENPLRVRVYDMSGAHLRDIGTEGQGPGEFNRVFSIAIRPDGKLLVRADGNGRMIAFSLDGEFLEDWPLPGGYATSLAMVMMADGTVYTRLPVGEIDEMGIRRGGMVPFGIDGSQAGDPVFLPHDEPILTFEEIARTLSSGARTTTRMSVPFSPRTPSALSPLGAMIVGVGDEYRFEVRRFDGTTLMVERVAQPVAVLPDEAAWHRRYTTARARYLDGSWSWSGPDVPANKPLFSRTFVRDDLVLLRMEDEAGTIMVKRYRLVLPGEDDST